LQIQNLEPDQKNKCFLELSEIYQKIDSDLSKLEQPCTGCGMCCDFKQAEHRLYISSLEFIYLIEHNKLNDFKNNDICPYRINGKCSVREHRMIGCRTYFRLHTEKDREKSEGIYEKYLKELKLLYQKYDIPWEYRDLMGFLQEYSKTPQSL
jgi:Fe-S-cluster containining protein